MSSRVWLLIIYRGSEKKKHEIAQANAHLQVQVKVANLTRHKNEMFKCFFCFLECLRKYVLKKLLLQKIVPKAIFAVRFLKSGRLDVFKSGVCGAGLNRNME